MLLCFLTKYQGLEYSGHGEVSMSLSKCQAALQRGCIILYSYCHCTALSCMSFRLWKSHSQPIPGMMRIFNFSHCAKYIINHCGFKIYFPNDVEHPFGCFYDILYILWQCVCLHICPHQIF